VADTEVVLYDERESVGFISLNRPEKKNTLTDAVIPPEGSGTSPPTSSRSTSS